MQRAYCINNLNTIKLSLCAFVCVVAHVARLQTLFRDVKLSFNVDTSQCPGSPWGDWEDIVLAPACASIWSQSAIQAFSQSAVNKALNFNKLLSVARANMCQLLTPHTLAHTHIALNAVIESMAFQLPHFRVRM